MKAPGMALVGLFGILILVAIIAVAVKVAQGSDRKLDTPAARDESSLDQIRKLGELRDAGVITEDEFCTKKDELLRRL
jgi:hypothetical protein